MITLLIVATLTQIFVLNQVYGMKKFFKEILITFNILTENKKHHSQKDANRCKMCPDEIQIA